MHLFRWLTVAASLVALLPGCSKYKEQCHGFTLALTVADDAYRDMGAAALRGDRAKFDKASKDLKAAVAQIKTVETTGDGLREKMLATSKGDYAQQSLVLIPAYQKMLDAVQKDPKSVDLKYDADINVMQFDTSPEVKKAIDDVRQTVTMYRKGDNCTLLRVNEARYLAWCPVAGLLAFGPRVAPEIHQRS